MLHRTDLRRDRAAAVVPVADADRLSVRRHREGTHGRDHLLKEPVVMRSEEFLLECLLRAGLRDVLAVEPATGGLAALAGIATRRDAPPVFVKAFAEPPAEDVFAAEAEGLAM